MNRFRVRREGFILGVVQAETHTQAQEQAIDTFGNSAICDEQPIANEPIDIDAVIHNRDLSIRPVYKSLYVVGKTESTLTEKLNATLHSLMGKFIAAITFGITKAGVAKESTLSEEVSSSVIIPVIIPYARILYFDLAEVVTAKTLAEAMKKAEIHPDDVQFGIRLLGDLNTNEALFTYANVLEIEWSRHTDWHKDRVNCIQAIRRKKGWI